MKKYKRNDPELLLAILNKMLESNNITVKDITESPEYNENSRWYDKYKFHSEEEYNEWRNFTIEILTKHTTPKISKKMAEKEFDYINLMWGLGIEK